MILQQKKVAKIFHEYRKFTQNFLNISIYIALETNVYESLSIVCHKHQR